MGVRAEAPGAALLCNNALNTQLLLTERVAYVESNTPRESCSLTALVVRPLRAALRAVWRNSTAICIGSMQFEF